MTEDITYRDQARALYRSIRYQPKLIALAISLSLLAALLEGFGLGFILPIVELAQGEVNPEEATGLLKAFVEFYGYIGLPFTLGWLIVGISVVMTVRYTTSFLMAWLRGAIGTYYIRHIQRQAFEQAMMANIAYFDREGSDRILNAIVTQAEYAGRSIRWVLQVFEKGLLGIIYISIALVLAPVLTVATAIGFVGLTYFFRHVLEGGYAIGDRVAEANERIQEYAQAGTQGIRDVKLFGLTDEIIEDFRGAVNSFTTARIRYFRNSQAIGNYYNLLTAVMLFLLIYAGLRYSNLALGQLAIFLFAMFRLGPAVSQLNKRIYNLEAELPHLVRSQKFIDELYAHAEPSDGGRMAPERIESITFEDVNFSYEGDNGYVLKDLSLTFSQGEFIAFVGQSGAGKSTIASLLTRLYDPDSGEIRANETNIEQFDVTEWRSKVAVVRQNPHIFNTTLEENVTIGNRDANRSDIEAVCDIAQVTEFIDNLPNGYETELGDDGVKLSGGQRQRVAIARALLKDGEILILDEATSDLDTHLEEKVHTAIEGLERDYAMVVIAHRLSTVTNADRIYTLANGHITESGSHGELLKVDGEYAKLYETQSVT